MLLLVATFAVVISGGEDGVILCIPDPDLDVDAEPANDTTSSSFGVVGTSAELFSSSKLLFNLWFSILFNEFCNLLSFLLSTINVSIDDDAHVEFRCLFEFSFEFILRIQGTMLSILILPINHYFV